MSSYSQGVTFFLNGHKFTFMENKENCLSLLRDDLFTIDYIRRAALAGTLQQYEITRDNVDKISIMRADSQEFAQDILNTSGCESLFTTDDPEEELSLELVPVENKRPNKKEKKFEFNKEATTTLLELRGSEKFDKLFGDKKNNKSHLWLKVANDMKEMGFNLGEKAGEKCRQKFANLQKTYVNFNQNARQTGAGSIEKPWFYELIDAILGDKHKISPPFILDTEKENCVNEVDIVESFETDYMAGCSTSTSIMGQASTTKTAQASCTKAKTFISEKSKEINTPKRKNLSSQLQNVKMSVKPRVKTMAEVVQDMHETTKRAIESNTEMLSSFLKRQEELQMQENEHKAAMIKLLSTLLKPNKHKRKREYSSESD